MKLPALLTTAQLEQSTVVANNRMNRERMLCGVNSYQHELGSGRAGAAIDLYGWLTAQANEHGGVRWMDLCCGSGNALIQSASALQTKGNSGDMRMEGLDLAGMFSAVPDPLKQMLHLQAGSVSDWLPKESYDLITCIHGLHYLGDKFGLLRKAMGCLKTDGLLVANLDLNNLKDAEGKPLRAWWMAECRRMGWKYDSRRHLLQVAGRQDWSRTWLFLGANDQAGPNYSGQAAVDSYYLME